MSLSTLLLFQGLILLFFCFVVLCFQKGWEKKNPTPNPTNKPTVIYLLPDKDCKEIQEEHPSTKG